MIKIGQAPYLECSTRGDRRFSALCASINTYNGRTIEELYQGAKIFPGGYTGLPVRFAKGRRAINADWCAKYYGYLWDLYIWENPHLLPVLQQASGLSDRFGQSGHCCQAIELWRIRNG